MEVKIGIQHAPRELVVDTDEKAEAIEKLVSRGGRRRDGVLTLTDTKGRKVVVPGAASSPTSRSAAASSGRSASAASVS